MAGWGLAFVGCWLISSLGPLSVVGAIAPLFLAFFCWRRSKVLGAMFALANPLVLVALLAVSSYFCGTGKLHFHGLPGPQSFNLDRRTMLPKSGGGCVVNGSEWLGDGWNNFVLRTCVAMFGPMKGSPSGPYPEDTAISGPWSEAEPIKLEEFARGAITVGAKSRTVPQGERLLEAYAPWSRDQLENPSDSLWENEDYAIQLQAKDFGGGTFAVRIGTIYGGSPSESTVLFGGEPAKIIGYFWPREGRSRQQRFPPVNPGT